MFQSLRFSFYEYQSCFNFLSALIWIQGYPPANISIHISYPLKERHAFESMIFGQTSRGMVGDVFSFPGGCQICRRFSLNQPAVLARPVPSGDLDQNQSCHESQVATKTTPKNGGGMRWEIWFSNDNESIVVGRSGHGSKEFSIKVRLNELQVHPQKFNIDIKKWPYF